MCHVSCPLISTQKKSGRLSHLHWHTGPGKKYLGKDPSGHDVIGTPSQGATYTERGFVETLCNLDQTPAQTMPPGGRKRR